LADVRFAAKIRHSVAAQCRSPWANGDILHCGKQQTIGDKSSDASAVDRCRHRQTGGSAEEMTCGYDGCSYPAMPYVGLVICAVTGSNVAQRLGLDADRFAIVIIFLVSALIGSRLYFVLLRHFREQYFVRQ
jgi:hypothetical protein